MAFLWLLDVAGTRKGLT